MEENKKPVPPMMEQKLVKFEIGKLLALVITVVVVAGVAGIFLTSNYFKGDLGDAQNGALSQDEEFALQQNCNTFTIPQIQERLSSSYVTAEEKSILHACMNELYEDRSTVPQIVPKDDDTVNTTVPQIVPRDDDTVNTTVPQIVPKDDDTVNTTVPAIVPKDDDTVNTTVPQIVPRDDDTVNTTVPAIKK